MNLKFICILFTTSCTQPRVAVAHSGEMEEKEEGGSTVAAESLARYSSLVSMLFK
jgi:hypothetical protein